MRDWLKKRRGTIALTVFLSTWYGFQIVVLQLFGENTATWWFYLEMPPNAVSPGIVLAPISHRIDTLTHLGSNLIFLIIAGSIVEPYISRKRLIGLVLISSYASIYIANLTVPLHKFWMTVGTSGGVLALWTYAGLYMGKSAISAFSDGIAFSRHGIETASCVFLLLSTIVIFIHQLMWIPKPHSGHLAGMALGSLYYAIERDYL